MEETTGSIINFIERVFNTYLVLITELMQNETIPETLRYILIAAYSLFFLVLLFLIFWFLKFLVNLIAKGISALFLEMNKALKEPDSVPYVSSLVLLRSIPWYFILLSSILVLCGIAALLTGSTTWTESFKYILGATVGSLIGVIKKKEDIDFEESLFDRLGSRTSLPGTSQKKVTKQKKSVSSKKS